MMLFVNFKTYEEATGENAARLAKLCEKVSKETKIDIVPCVQAADIFRVSQKVKVPVFAQSADPIEYGAHTGSILIDSLIQAGAKGTIINHSEKRINTGDIKKIVELCRKKKFTVLVCCQDADEVKKFSSLNPDYIAYEPPELIGGNISVSSAKPEIIEESVDNAGNVPLIVGAGVKNRNDVSTSIELGAKGILVASGIVKAENQEKALRDLAGGF